MADIFVSYTSQDRHWAFWIGQELEKLGHTARIDAWEISGGGDIAAWMDERHDKADHILCVVSETYLGKPYSSWERRSAQWAAQTDRPNFVLPIKIEDCKLRTLLASVKYCDLFGMEENEARARLAEFLKPAGKPIGPVPFPGAKKGGASIAASPPRVEVAFPGKIDPERKTRTVAISNIRITVPRHFLGRDDDLAAIDKALASSNGRAAITALHGLRGVGKTTLAAAFAERHRNDYRAIWWIRAETEPSMRADLVGLGVRMEWVTADAPEEPALKIVMDRLRDKGYGILLIYDNANNAREFEKYAPRGSAARLIVTSNAPDWRGVAAPVEIEVWPPEIGATFLIERTGQSDHVAAITLSEALGGLPLAHEQAAAYCERLGLSLAGYLALFKAGSTELLDADRDVPYDYGKTVAKTFSFAIDQAAKLHPAAESLIIYAALLAPEPIPLYLFSEGRENLFGPLASSIEGNGLNEAVAALRAFALISREVIHDERDASVTTDCVRLHRLVREVAAGRGREKINDAKRALIDVLGAAYPRNFYREPATWPRIRRLDAHGTELVVEFTLAPNDTQVQLADILTSLGAFRHHVLGAYSEARPLFERALAILERVLGREHRSTCVCVSFLALLLKDQGHPDAARPLFERVLKITETTKGTEHLDTASALNNLGTLLHSKGDFAGARPLFERALTIRENALGLSNPATALVMSNLGNALYGYGDLEGAESLLERALAIREETLGRSHPEVAASLRSLGQLLFAKRQPQKAWQFMQQALAMEEQLFGLKHPRTQNTAKIAVAQLGALGWNREAALLRERFAVPTN